MTLTELRYLLAVDKLRHFGRAAESCFVSQPSLSVAIRKLEEELGVAIFERRSTEISVTPVGARIIEQARRVLDEAHRIYDVAVSAQDPLSIPVRLGVIPTVAPYLLPPMLAELSRTVKQMPVYLEEGFTSMLLNKLKDGELDVAIMANTVERSGLMIQELYEEDFVVAVPRHHAWINRSFINPDELGEQTMLLLSAGHCFRDQVLSVCSELKTPAYQSPRTAINQGHMVEGTSLQTICHMVAQGLGINVLPSSAVPYLAEANSRLRILNFRTPAPQRRVIMGWRKSFPRMSAIEALVKAARTVVLNGCNMLDESPRYDK